MASVDVLSNLQKLEQRDLGLDRLLREEAMNLARRGEWTRSVLLMESVLRESPHNGDAMLDLAQLMRHAGLEESYFTWIKEACKKSELIRVKWRHELDTMEKEKHVESERNKTWWGVASRHASEMPHESLIAYPERETTFQAGADLVGYCCAGMLGGAAGTRNASINTLLDDSKVVYAIGIISAHQVLVWRHGRSPIELQVYCASADEARWIERSFELNQWEHDARVDVVLSKNVLDQTIDSGDVIVCDSLATLSMTIAATSGGRLRPGIGYVLHGRLPDWGWLWELGKQNCDTHSWLCEMSSELMWGHYSMKNPVKEAIMRALTEREQYVAVCIGK